MTAVKSPVLGSSSGGPPEVWEGLGVTRRSVFLQRQGGAPHSNTARVKSWSAQHDAFHSGGFTEGAGCCSLHTSFVNPRSQVSKAEVEYCPHLQMRKMRLQAVDLLETDE